MVRTVTPREAEALLRAGDVTVVDVREPSEWASGHLPGARLVPLASLEADFSVAALSGRVLFVCAKGGRSRTAAELAVANGLVDVFSLDGGTPAWAAERRALEHSDAPSTPAPATDIPRPSPRVATDPELDAIVGPNIRELRTKHGLTLDILAGLSGVGRQTLGQIELGRTVPSLGTLWKIARAFDVPFSALLAVPQTHATRVLKREHAQRLVSADGRFSSRALFPAGDAGNIEFYELWLAGHGREDADAHAPGTRENLVVTAGRVVIEVARERFELAAGDAIVFHADVPHAYINPASEECRMNLVMAYAT